VVEPSEERRSKQRSCIACRTSRERSELLRFVLGPEGELVFDGQRKLPGRGVHVCPDPGCLKRAVERRGFDRGFRRTVKVGKADELFATICSWAQRRALSMLGLARRAGLLIAGGDEVLAGMASGEVALVVLANDLSSRRRADVEWKAESLGVPWRALSTREALGQAVGRPPTGILGLQAGPQLSPLQQATDWLVRFGDSQAPEGGRAGVAERRLEA